MSIFRPLAAAIAITLLGFLTAIMPVVAQTDLNVDPPPLPDLAPIIERGTLIVAQINENVPPMFNKQEDGTLVGFDIDLASDIARKLDVELEFLRTAETYDDVVRQVAAGDADMAISNLSRTARRAKVVLFSQPYLRQKRTLLINRRAGLRFRASCPTVKELLENAEVNNILGVQDESNLAAEIKYLSAEAKPRFFEEAIDLFTAVYEGEIAIALQGELGSRLYLKRNPAARIHLKLCEIGPNPALIAIAVPPGRYGLVHWLNIFMDEHEIDFSATEILAKDGDWWF